MPTGYLTLVYHPPFLHNNEELDAESEEVEALCKKFPTRSSDQED